MSPTIRPVTAQEIGRLPAIERDAATRFRTVGLDAIADADPSDENFIRSVRTAGEVLGVELDGALVGFALAGRLDDALHIYEVSVASAHGGHGLGSRLIEALGEAALRRSIGALSLSTFADVPWNGPFYARRGFAVVDEAGWTPAFHLLRAVERAAGLPIDRRVFMRKELS